MSLTPLPQKRRGIRREIELGLHRYYVTFNFDETRRLREVFCSGPKVGSEQQAIVNDASIAISLLLRSGHRIDALRQSFGEDRAEGAANGPPSSILGAIAAAGASLETELAGGPL